MREPELITHFKKLDMVNIRDRLSTLRSDVVRCQKMESLDDCAYGLREVARVLRYLSDLILSQTGEGEGA